MAQTTENKIKILSLNKRVEVFFCEPIIVKNQIKMQKFHYEFFLQKDFNIADVFFCNTEIKQLHL